MIVYTAAGDKIDLPKNSFMGAGGEGQIFIRGNLCYKVYFEPSNCISTKKIKELEKLNKSEIIRPLDPITDSKYTNIGYSMNLVPKPNYTLCQLFPQAFKTRNSINQVHLNKIIMKLKEGIEFIHSNNILIVDVNELNFLVDERFDNIYFIDVDSYQTPNFPATAIMDSIRDLHSSTFTKETDWFSFAVLTFQLLLGIHPYRGKHPSIKDMHERMLKNISVLNKDVSVPAIVPDFKSIPPSYLSWYTEVFENGKRIPPPDNIDSNIIIQKKTNISSGILFIIELLSKFPSNIENINGDLVVGKDNIYHIKNPHIIKSKTSNNIILSENNKICNLEIKEELLHVNGIQKSIGADSLITFNNRAIIKNKDKIVELRFIQENIILPKQIGNVMENSTQLFEGVAVQNILGSYYVSMLTIHNTNYQIRMKELDNHKIINAWANKTVLIIITNKAGKYNRFTFKFDLEYKKYETILEEDTQNTSINCIITDKGILVEINENDEVIISSIIPSSTQKQVIKDKNISSECKLYRLDDKIVFTIEDKIYTITTK